MPITPDMSNRQCTVTTQRITEQETHRQDNEGLLYFQQQPSHSGTESESTPVPLPFNEVVPHPKKESVSIFAQFAELLRKFFGIEEQPAAEKLLNQFQEGPSQEIFDVEGSDKVREFATLMSYIKKPEKNAAEGVICLSEDNKYANFWLGDSQINKEPIELSEDDIKFIKGNTESKSGNQYVRTFSPTTLLLIKEIRESSRYPIPTRYFLEKRTRGVPSNKSFARDVGESSGNKPPDKPVPNTFARECKELTNNRRFKEHIELTGHDILHSIGLTTSKSKDSSSHKPQVFRQEYTPLSRWRKTDYYVGTKQTFDCINKKGGEEVTVKITMVTKLSEEWPDGVQSFKGVTTGYTVNVIAVKNTQ